MAFELDEAWRTGGDARYAVVDGSGTAHFEGEGAAEVRLQAVYDLVDERWIHVGYALGGENKSPTALIPAIVAPIAVGSICPMQPKKPDACTYGRVW